MTKKKKKQKKENRQNRKDEIWMKSKYNQTLRAWGLLGLWGQMFSTVAVVSLVGAAASTVANLNDYHIFTLLMRSRHVAKVRHTRTYRLAIRWFEKSPFALLVTFNILPLPLDVVRPLAASHRYGRLPFAAANFLGRLGRYAVIATVTYMLGSQGWIAVVALLGLACLLTLPRLVKKLRR